MKKEIIEKLENVKLWTYDEELNYKTDYSEVFYTLSKFTAGIRMPCYLNNFDYSLKIYLDDKTIYDKISKDLDSLIYYLETFAIQYIFQEKKTEDILEELE